MNPVIPRFFKRALLATIVSVAAVYVSDYLLLRLRMAHPRAGAAFGVATIYDAATMKSGRVELYYNQPLNQVCVHALFPHLSYAPCWYLGRNPVKTISFAAPAGSDLG